MAVNILFSNNASTTLAESLSSGATSCQVATGSGALFPSPSGSQYFRMTFTDAATGLVNEIVECTNVTGDVLTIVRAQEGTTARAWNIGDNAQLLITAGGLQDIQGESAPTADKWTTARNLALTGDVTATLASVDGSANVSAAATLATVNASPGSTGDGTHVSQITTNGKGLVTSNTSVAITSAPKWTTARTLSFTGDATGSGSVDGSADVGTALTLSTVNASPGTTGDASHVTQLTTNGKGLVTANSSVAINITPTQANVFKFSQAGIALATSATNNYAHGFPGVPILIQAVLVCVTADLGYSPGDVVKCPTGANGHGITTWATATNVGYSTDSSNPFINPKAGGGTMSITLADWTLTLEAIYF